MPTDTTLDTSKMSAADKIKAANSLYSTANTLAKSPDYQKSLGGYYAADTAAFEYQTNQMGTTEGSGQDLNWLVGDAPNPGQTYRDLAGQVTDSFKQANDLITSAVKDDPSLIKSLSPQTQLQYSFSRWKSGDISRNDYADTAHQIMADYKIPEYNYDASGNRTQFNVFGDQVAQGGLNPNPLVPTTLVGAYNIRNNPQDSYDIFQKIATNPYVNAAVALFAPELQYILAPIRAGIHGPSLADALIMVNGALNLAGIDLAKMATNAGKEALGSVFGKENIQTIIDTFDKAKSDLKDMGTSVFDGAFGDGAAAALTKDYKDIKSSILGVKNDVVDTVKDIFNPSATGATGATTSLEQIGTRPTTLDTSGGVASVLGTGVEEIPIYGNSLASTAVSTLGGAAAVGNAAANANQAVRNAEDATTSPEQITITAPRQYSQSDLTDLWRANRATITPDQEAAWRATNPQVTDAQVAQAKANVATEDKPVDKGVEEITVTGKQPVTHGLDLTALGNTLGVDTSFDAATNVQPPDPNVQPPDPNIPPKDPIEEITITAPRDGGITPIVFPPIITDVPGNLKTLTPTPVTVTPPTVNNNLKWPGGGAPTTTPTNTSPSTGARTDITSNPLTDIKYLYDMAGDSIFAPNVTSQLTKEKQKQSLAYNTNPTGSGKVGQFDIVAEALRLLGA